MSSVKCQKNYTESYLDEIRVMLQHILKVKMAAPKSEKWDLLDRFKLLEMKYYDVKRVLDIRRENKLLKAYAKLSKNICLIL